MGSSYSRRNLLRKTVFWGTGLAVGLLGGAALLKIFNGSNPQTNPMYKVKSTPQPLTPEEEYRQILSDWGIDIDKTKIYGMNVLNGDIKSAYLEAYGFTPDGKFVMDIGSYIRILDILNPCSDGMVDGTLQAPHDWYISGGQVFGKHYNRVNLPVFSGGRFIGSLHRTNDRNAKEIPLEEALNCP